MIDEHAEQRGQRRRLARGRNEAALEGVADLLLGRLLGLAVLVGFLGHAQRARSGHDVAEVVGSAWRSSISPLAIILSTVSTIARRASATSRAGAVPPPCSSASTMRREREASAERMAAWNGSSVPFRASTSRSIGTWSNTAVRAGGDRSARSSKVKSRLLSALASSGRTSARLCSTASDCVLSRRLRMSAMPVCEAGAPRGDQLLGERALDHAQHLVGHALDAEHPAQQLGAVVGGKRAQRLGGRVRIDPGEDERHRLRMLLDQEGRAAPRPWSVAILSQTGSVASLRRPAPPPPPAAAPRA